MTTDGKSSNTFPFHNLPPNSKSLKRSFIFFSPFPLLDKRKLSGDSCYPQNLWLNTKPKVNSPIVLHFVFKIEPKNVNEALIDEFWINDIEDELSQFKRNEVGDLVLRSSGTNINGTRCVYKNKTSESGVVTRNKTRLLA